MEAGDGAISSFTIDEHNIWLVVWAELRASLVRSSRREAVRDTIPLADAGSLSSGPKSTVIFALLRPPHSLQAYDRNGSLMWSAAPASALSSSDSMPPSAISQFVFAVDDTTVLQLLADLQSDRRWFARYSMASSASRRIRGFRSPMGLGAYDREQMILVGFRESNDGGQIVELRLEWVH